MFTTTNEKRVNYNSYFNLVIIITDFMKFTNSLYEIKKMFSKKNNFTF